jgi:hypothetical protein
MYIILGCGFSGVGRRRGVDSIDLLLMYIRRIVHLAVESCFMKLLGHILQYLRIHLKILKS